MREIILNFPQQFKIGIEIAKNLKIEKTNLKNFVLAGMGGSALPGDLLRIILRNYPSRIENFLIHRDYNLPQFVNKKFLLGCISYSGNTEETISAFLEGQKRKMKSFVISSGGELENLAKKFQVPFAKIPSGYPPRMALGFQFSVLILILAKFGLISNFEKDFLRLVQTLVPSKLERKGKILAKKILGKIPLIYTSANFRELAKIWKIKFNENSKVPAFFNYFPELNHNEMTGIGEAKGKFQKIFSAIFLWSKSENPRNLKRMKILAQIFKEKGIEVYFLEIEGKNLFEKIFKNILISDWASFYLAKFQKIDPIPVKLVEEFKNRMKK